MTIRLRIRRAAIASALRKKVGDTIPTSRPGSLANDHFSITLLYKGEDKLRVQSISADGVRGWWFNERFGGGQDASVPNRYMDEFDLQITHYYRGHEFRSFSARRYFWNKATAYAARAALWDRAIQFLFNRRRLIRQDRMAILRYIFERTVDKPDFRTSSIDLPMNMYGMRFFGRPDYENLLGYYRLVIKSLIASGDLVANQGSVELAPQAVATLQAHEEVELRHNDMVRQQRLLGWLTAALVCVGLLQAGSSIWSAAQRSPEPVETFQPVYPTWPPKSAAPPGETPHGN